MWKMKHNVIHHTYTNIHGVDDDIEARPLMRLCDEQPLIKYTGISIFISGFPILYYIFIGFL